MVKHYILMSSAYTEGTRIALDVTDPEKLNTESIRRIIDRVRRDCGNDVPLSTHLIGTEDKSWESVVKYDPFFEGVKCIDSVEEFSRKIKAGRTLKGLDVATYILSKIKCTHLSLQKLVYFAYADYLCEFSKPLFHDRIYAFRHGPVVDSVYEAYKNSGSQYVEPLEEPIKDNMVQTGVGEMPARSRILFAEDGAEKLCSIDKTIQRYGKFSTGKLVDITHRGNSPWSHVDSSKPYQTISDDLIKTYHYIEC